MLTRLDKITVTLERRDDGGLRVSSEDMPGLHLSGPDPELVMADVLTAIEGLLEARD